MDGKLPRSTHKRPYVEDLIDDDDAATKPPKQKKVRFPKGKKVKAGDEVVDFGKSEDGSSEAKNARLAATERAKRRSQITEELFSEEVNDISAAEVSYENNETFDDDGIQIEPFNLDKERQEGYFDEQGNFVEYVNENQIKDAWLDSVDVEERYAGKISEANDNNEPQELSSEDIGTIKRRIANLLEPGETVLQALRRLKGSSNQRKEKMSAETQRLFDQLTEDANKLLDNGEYNVYHDKQEVFQREAEGYERLAMARGRTSTSASQEERDFNDKKGLLPDVTNIGATTSSAATTNVAGSNPNASSAENPSNGDAVYDMFADDDDDNATDKPNANNFDSRPNADGVGQFPSDGTQGSSEAGTSETDYVFDEASGYYYSSSTGYYYDPSTGLFYDSTSGQWYSYNAETGIYDIVNGAASNTT